MTELRFALRALAREFRSGELAILGLALVIAVAAVSSVGLFTDRVARAMERQAGDILAADLVVVSRDRPTDVFAMEAAQRGLRTSTRWSLASVIVAGDANALANVNAVAEGYPLRGAVSVSDELFGERRSASSIPAPGIAWLDTRLFAQLGIEPGDTIRIGESAFVASHVLESIPDAGFGFTSMAPTALMNLADIESTGLIQPGSRVRYRSLFAGGTEEIDAFGLWAAERLERGAELVDVREARPELGAALNRAERFLGLAAIVAVLLSSISVAMAARRYAARHLDAIAIIKCVGGTQAFVLRAYTLQVLLIGLAGGAVGVAIGWLAQLGLVELMAGLLAVDDLPAARLMSAATGVATGMIVLAGFAVPPLLPLRRVSPARVLRRDLDPPPVAGWVAYGAAVGAIALLLYAQTRDAELTLLTGGGAAFAALAFAGAAWGLLRILGGLRGRVGVAWRYGLANIVRRRRESIAQLVAFGLGLMVLLLLGIVRADLMSGWQRTLSTDAPNHFMINIQTDERAALSGVFEQAGLTPPTLYPMVRARLTQIGGTPVADIDFSGRGRGFADREQNLSWAAQPQRDNRVVAGEWWSEAEHGQPLISLETEAAERLGVGTGDVLEFDVAGESLQVTVHNLRTVDWDSFNPNFFMVLPPGVLDGLPASWVGAAFVPRDERGVFIELLRTLPTVTVIDIEAILDQVRGVVAQASRAVEFVFLFTLAAGIAVMLAAINASRDERRRETAMLRTFGAARTTVLKGLAAEFVVLGALAGLLAALAASVIGAVLAVQVFDFAYGGSPWVWAAGLLGGGVGIGSIGLLATRKTLDESPLVVLRRA
ncbi:MAG: FtsX-like permease family protein [Gammaproteobacteria bacterium]